MRLATRILIISFFLTPAVIAEDSSLGVSAEIGQKHFNTYCSSCHGIDATGAGPAAKALKIPPPDLRQISKRNGGDFPVERITEVIDGRADTKAHGSREMPIWGRQFSNTVGGGSMGEEVVRGELNVLINYLRSIQE